VIERRRLIALGLVAAAGLGCRGETARAPLHVAAAVSLTESLQRAVDAWERSTSETAVLNFAASNVLARQIEEGAPVDLFVSADAVQMDRLVSRRLVEPTSVVPLLSNQLVVVTPVDRRLPAPAPDGLKDPRVSRIALGDPAGVPAGLYARRWLESRGLWAAVEPKVVPAASVRAALAAVEAGNADAAVVYRTDVLANPRVHVEHVVPHDEGPRIIYPAGIVTASRAPERARALLSWLASDEGRAIFVDAGFSVPAPSVP